VREFSKTDEAEESDPNKDIWFLIDEKGTATQEKSSTPCHLRFCSNAGSDRRAVLTLINTMSANFD